MIPADCNDPSCRNSRFIERIRCGFCLVRSWLVGRGKEKARRQSDVFRSLSDPLTTNYLNVKKVFCHNMFRVSDTMGERGMLPRNAAATPQKARSMQKFLDKWALPVAGVLGLAALAYAIFWH